MGIKLTALADNVIHTSDRNLDGTTVASVVITGMAVVFIALILLIFVVWLYGKIFDVINKKAEEKAAAAEKAAEASKPAPAPVVTEAPITEDGIDEQTVAVIMAAVEAYGEQTGKKLAVRGIKPSSSNKPSRNAWSAAGLAEATRPF